jgi:hypothetical protein
VHGSVGTAFQHSALNLAHKHSFIAEGTQGAIRSAIRLRVNGNEFDTQLGKLGLKLGSHPSRLRQGKGAPSSREPYDLFFATHFAPSQGWKGDACQ